MKEPTQNDPSNRDTTLVGNSAAPPPDESVATNSGVFGPINSSSVGPTVSSDGSGKSPPTGNRGSS
jgi:hypothetical protein